MPRGLLAPLSPKEETTLRRIALGIADPPSLPAGDVIRLKQLDLVQDANDTLQLTATGKQRYSMLSRSTLFPADTAPADAIASALAKQARALRS
jgi:hypothetical protein